MAVQTINGITLNYPGDPCTVFNPCKFILTGTMSRAKVRITHGGRNYDATYQTPNGGALDLREFLQAFFDGLSMGQQFTQMSDVMASELGKSVNITITALNAANTTLATFNLTIYCVWGGTAVGEDYELASRTGTKRVKWFSHYPFTVGLFTNTAASLNYEDDHQNAIKVLTLPAKGLYDINIDDDGGSSVESLHIYNNASPYTEHYIIDIDRDADEGIYLRWVDRQGFWRYWLFKAGDPTRQAASRFGMWYRNDMALHDNLMGWQGAAGRRQSLSRNDVQPLCAPLVDQATFDMLQGVTTSPCVDMYLGKDSHDDPMWTAVTVEAGQYTKDVKKPEQDFVFNLVLPEIPVQTL